jgi:hypothetical protein
MKMLTTLIAILAGALSAATATLAVPALAAGTQLQGGRVDVCGPAP